MIGQHKKYLDNLKKDILLFSKILGEHTLQKNNLSELKMGNLLRNIVSEHKIYLNAFKIAFKKEKKT